MSTARNEGNNSGSDGNVSGGKGNKNLYIQMLKRGGDGMQSSMPLALNLFLCFVALCILYGFYIAFGLAWLTAMTEMGEDLNWAFFWCNGISWWWYDGISCIFNEITTNGLVGTIISW